MELSIGSKKEISCNQDFLSKRVLYTFRRCPFAIRARWAISINNLYVNIKEIELKNKPKELFTISSKGTVPVLITEDGEIYDESIDIMNWSISKGGKYKGMHGSSKEEKEQISLLIKKNDNEFKFHLDRFKYASRYPNESKKEHRMEARKILLSYEKNLSNLNNLNGKMFLLGKEQTIADWSIWPFVRQFSLADKESFEKDYELNNLRKWLNYFISHETFSRIMKKNINFL